jgi:AcrR family transcriptional regulator
MAEPDDPATDPLLDAARACVLAVGVRRTTLTDVARRAGVSRMTVYRRFPDVTALLQALMTREFGALIVDDDGDGSVRERFVRSTIAGCARLVDDPLFRRILGVDPELVLPYFTQRYGAFQRAVLATLAERLRAGMAEGSVRETDPEVLAAAVESALRGYVLSALAEDQGDLRAPVLAELEHMLDAWLAPERT